MTMGISVDVLGRVHLQTHIYADAIADKLFEDNNNNNNKILAT